MKLKAIATSAVIAALMVSRAEPVMADGDALVGGIIGGIIGGAIVSEANKNKNKRSTRSTRSAAPSGVSSAQRESNREVQTALNYFGFPVGTPDGAIGPKSRSAISTYQATLGYPATGQLTEYERNLLVTAYYRGMSGGPVVTQTAATHPLGIKGLLIVQRDEMAGVAPVVAPPVETFVATPVAPEDAPLVRGSVAAATAAALPKLMPEAAPADVAASDDGALPSFMATGAVQVSLASHCNKVSLITNGNGGYTTAAAMTDPNFALSEQFCLARTYAMSQGEEIAASVAGFTPAQISEQCLAFGDVLADQVAALSLQPVDVVQAGVTDFIAKSGMSPVQLSGTAKVCLGVGYTTDNMDVAIGSALLLTAMGERGYAELLGHHLSQGFGATLRPDLAMGWYDMGVAAMGQGQAVFAPGMADRPEIIQKASYTLNGRAAELAPEAAVQEASLPDFGVAPEEVVIAPLVPEAPAVEDVVVAPAPEIAAPVEDMAATEDAMIVPDATPADDAMAFAETSPGLPDPMTNPGGAALSLAVALPMLIFGN
jgi:peptidoglycan hydrolase-like protein with peptidoglycan-binding domain